MLEVNNIHITSYNSPQNEQLAMVKNWLRRKGLQFIEALTNEVKTTYNTLDGLFETLNGKFRPQINETIKSLQFRKLCRSDNESTEGWMGRLRIMAAECNYQELDRQLKEQFIHGLNDKDMLGEIIKELTASRNNDHITSDNVLTWAKRVEVRRAKADAMSSITEEKEFDKIKTSRTIHKESPKT